VEPRNSNYYIFLIKMGSGSTTSNYHVKSKIISYLLFYIEVFRFRWNLDSGPRHPPLPL
jgi:hypothetical protein